MQRTLTATVVSRQRAMYTRPKLPSPICLRNVSSLYMICMHSKKHTGQSLQRLIELAYKVLYTFYMMRVMTTAASAQQQRFVMGHKKWCSRPGVHTGHNSAEVALQRCRVLSSSLMTSTSDKTSLTPR